MRILIASLKYSPVHNSICRALGEPLRKLEHVVMYLLPESAHWTVPASQIPYTFFLGHSGSNREILVETLGALSFGREPYHRVLQATAPDLVLFESPHPANEVLARTASRSAHPPRLWLLLHEPYVKDKQKHGRLRQWVIALHEYTTRRLARYLDGVLVPSHEAERQVHEVFPSLRDRSLFVPLLFEDRFDPSPVERRYASFIGHAVPAKGIDQFMDLVQAACENESDVEFQIATSSDIRPYLARLNAKARERLKVVNQAQLSDAEMDRAVRESWAVITPYRRVTQSAVVPVAFMHGTPVVSTALGAMPESVIPGETGYLVPPDGSYAEWRDMLQRAKQNWARLSANCRRFFLNHFDARRAPELLRPVLESVEC